MIPAVLTAPVAAVPAAVLLRHHPGAAHQVAADQVLPEVAVQALPGVLQAGAAAPHLQVLHLLQNQVHRMMIPQAPVIREMMTEMN